MSKPTKLSSAILALTTLFVMGFLALEGCNKKETLQPKVSDFFISECLDHLRYQADTICVTTIDNTKLKISTTNTLFDCCAESFNQEINLQGQDISILLLHEGPACDCVCGHCVELIIENLEIGNTYMVNIKKDDYDYFQFEVTFGPDTNLMFIREQ